MTTTPEDKPPAERPLVSVLMPCYNHEAYVSSAVESVWRQTHRPLELVAVDDGSTDRTFDHLVALAARSPIPMSVHRHANRGIAATLNAARAHAGGEWLSVLASDDAYVERKVAAQLEAAAARPGCVAVHSDYHCVGPDGDARVYQGSRLPPAEGVCHHDVLYGRRTIHGVAVMVRRGALDELGGWDERYPQEDWPLILRLTRRGEIAFSPERLVLRRVHTENVSSLMSQRRPFSPDDAGMDLLRAFCADRRELEHCGSIHVSVVMRSSIAQRGWRRARGALAYAWREFPRRRTYLLGQVAAGLRSLAWTRWLRPLVPRRLAERMSALRSARLAARLARSAGNPRATR